MYKLESKIPGVTVKLTPNPLNAKIELTDQAKRELALMIWTEHLIENYFLTGRCYLAPKSGTNVDGIYVPAPSDPKEATKWIERGEELWYEGWYGEKNGEDTTSVPRVERIMQNEVVKAYLDALTDEHGGDCTCVACSCERCHVEEVLGIDTLPSSKHINYRLKNLYFEEFASPEQKEADRICKEEWAKKWPPKPWTPDEATKQRWSIEDAKAREVWAEHKRLYKEQEGI